MAIYSIVTDRNVPSYFRLAVHVVKSVARTTSFL